MPFSFNVERPKDIAASFAKIKERVAKHGGRMSGDETSGIISVLGVKGNYDVSDKDIKITITKKSLIPRAMIEREVRNIFRD